MIQKRHATTHKAGHEIKTMFPSSQNLLFYFKGDRSKYVTVWEVENQHSCIVCVRAEMSKGTSDTGRSPYEFSCSIHWLLIIQA